MKLDRMASAISRHCAGSSERTWHLCELQKLALYNVEAARYRCQACHHQADRWAKARNEWATQEGVLHAQLNANFTRRPTSQGALAFAPDITYFLLGDLQVTVFQQEHYLENFVQATFDALPEKKLTGDSATPAYLLMVRGSEMLAPVMLKEHSPCSMHACAALTRQHTGREWRWKVPDQTFSGHHRANCCCKWRSQGDASAAPHAHKQQAQGIPG